MFLCTTNAVCIRPDLSCTVSIQNQIEEGEAFL
jgi:hypothetical protein